jgi:tetratricopeptide (TPR) repeat protein
LYQSGCAPKLKSAQTASAQPPSVSWKDAAGDSKSGSALYGNTQTPSTWDRVTSALKPKTQPGVAQAKIAADRAADDPLRLSHKPGAPTPELHVATAKLMEQTGKTDAAIEHLDKALALDPQSLDALMAYAHLLDRQGRFPEAVEKYQTACRLHPQYPGAFNDLGLCLARMHRLEESLDPLSQAIALDPRRDLYRNNIASVLVKLGRPDEAVRHLIAVHGEAIAHYNAGFLLQQDGQTQAAAWHFSRAAAVDPSFVAARQWADELNRTAPAPVQTIQIGQQPLQFHTPDTQFHTPATAQASPVGNRYEALYQSLTHPR